MSDNVEERPGGSLCDAVPLNGVDRSAARRAQMREATMARQAAERRFERAAPRRDSGRAEQVAAAQDRAAIFRDTLARIDAEQHAWLREQGVEPAPDRKR